MSEKQEQTKSELRENAESAIEEVYEAEVLDETEAEEVETDYDASLSKDDQEAIEREVNSIDPSELTLDSLKEKFQSLQDDTNDVADEINDEHKVKESKSQELLLEVKGKLTELLDTSSNDSTIGGFFKDFATKVGLKKVSDSIEESIDRNSSVKDALEGVFKKIDEHLDVLNKDIENYEKLYEKQYNAIKAFETQLKIVDKKIAFINETKDDKEKRQFRRFMSLKNQISSMKSVFTSNLEVVELQLQQAIVSEEKLALVKPQLKTHLKTQMSMSLKNAQQQSFNEAMGIIDQFANELTLKTLQETKKNAVELIKSSTKPLIEADTLDKMQDIKKETAKEMKKAYDESNKQMLEYNDKVEKMQQLSHDSKDMQLEYDKQLADDYKKKEAKKAKKEDKKN